MLKLPAGTARAEPTRQGLHTTTRTAKRGATAATQLLNIGHSKGREVKIKPKSEHCDGHGRVYLHWNCIPRREDWMWQ